MPRVTFLLILENAEHDLLLILLLIFVDHARAGREGRGGAQLRAREATAAPTVGRARAGDFTPAPLHSLSTQLRPHLTLILCTYFILQPTRGLFDAMVRCDLYPIEPGILSDILHHSPGTVVLDQARRGK